MMKNPNRTPQEYYKWEVFLDENLNSVEKNILYYFCHYDKDDRGITLDEISSDLCVSVSCLSANLKSLVSDGFLRKLKDTKSKSPIYEATLSGFVGKGFFIGGERG